MALGGAQNMKLPKELYVHVENEGHGDDEYLAANGTLGDAIDDDGPTKVGIYKLEKIVTYRKEAVRVK